MSKTPSSTDADHSSTLQSVNPLEPAGAIPSKSHFQHYSQNTPDSFSILMEETFSSASNLPCLMVVDGLLTLPSVQTPEKVGEMPSKSHFHQCSHLTPDSTAVLSGDTHSSISNCPSDDALSGTSVHSSAPPAAVPPKSHSQQSVCDTPDSLSLSSAEKFSSLSNKPYSMTVDDSSSFQRVHHPDQSCEKPSTSLSWQRSHNTPSPYLILMEETIPSVANTPHLVAVDDSSILPSIYPAEQAVERPSNNGSYQRSI